MYLHGDVMNRFWSKGDRYRNYTFTAGIKLFQILYITILEFKCEHDVVTKPNLVTLILYPPHPLSH